MILDSICGWIEPSLIDLWDAAFRSIFASSDSAAGPFSIPFFAYRLIRFFISLFLIASWNAVWIHHFHFQRLRWYYTASFYVQCGFIVYFSILATLSVLYMLFLAMPLNELGVYLLRIDAVVFNIAFIIALIQLSNIESNLFGLKKWYIILGIIMTALSLFGISFLLYPCGLIYLVVQILLLQRVLKGSYSN